jgi:RNA polymerase sigma factor (TIGR02999 family)
MLDFHHWFEFTLLITRTANESRHVTLFMTNRRDDRQNLNDLFAMTYAELRRMASVVKRRDSSATLNPTALVNEVWLKLAGSPGFVPISLLHFKRTAARAMRQVLMDAARRRKSQKRGGDLMVTFDGHPAKTITVGDELIALDDVLEELARMNPRQATMVESRFFGGLEISEIAELLEVSEATVLRDWRAARAWLANELRGR